MNRKKEEKVSLHPSKAKLEKLLKERNIELEGFKRELQIEATLEKVRSRTMRMLRTDDLREAVAEMFQQLKRLGFDTQACAIVLYDKKDVSVTHWVSGFSKKIYPQSYKHPFFNHPYFQDQLDAWEKGISKKVFTFKGKLKKSYDELIFTLGDLKNFPEDAKKEITSLEKIILSDAFMKYGMIEVLGNEPLPEEKLNILKRFASVFEQTYTRFLDLQKAEAQAREAQIEAALERVRTRTMAMHRSDEIADIVGKIFEELGYLDIILTRVLIWIFNKKEKYVDWWSANAELNNTAESYRLDFNQNPVFVTYLNAWKNKLPLFKYTLSGDLKISWEDYIFNNTGLAKMPMEVQKGMKGEGTIYTMSAISSYGLMMAGSREPLSDENTDIIQRFGRVFQQSYTRYLDVQKAETQTREAEIQLALERVRARTMAMHRSDELREVVFEFFEHLHPLGFAKWGFQLRIAREDEDGFNIWISTPAERILPEQYHIPTLDHWVLRKYWNTYKKQIDQVTIEVKGEDKLKLDLLLFEKSDVKKFSSKVKKSILDYDYVQFSVASMRYGLLEAIDVEPIPQEEFEVLKRFAKVFEQTYTRFLDLQKAEAQAREAQIEVALERVRSRGMAMHRSDELAEVATILYEELVMLGIRDFMNCGFVEVDEEQKAQYGWSTLPDGSMSEGYYLPLIGDPVLKRRYEAWKAKIPAFHQSVGGNDLKKHMEFVFKTIGSEEVKEMAQKSFPDPTIFYCFNFSHGYLNIITDKKINEENELILVRFSKAFEQTYTRFLDLRKAEAQAREAQIEVALERVRARTMAMHKSDELADAASVLFKQLRELGGSLWSTGFVLIDDQKREDECWMSNPEGEIWPPIFIPNTKDTAHKNMYDNWVRGVDYFSMEEGGKILEDHYSYLMSLPKAGQVFHDLIEAGIAMPTWQQYHAAYFKHGYLLIITLENYEDSELLIRFAKVFDQTYTRFLDLKKAEEQVREAQIEASLERVRVRSMAMHNSEELLDVAHQLYKELEILGVPQYMTGFVQVDKTGQKQKVWVTAPNGNRTDPFFLPLKGDSVLKTRYNSWEKQDPVFCQRVSGKALKKHLSYVSKHYDSAEAVEIGNQFPDTIIFYCGNFSEGYLHILSEVKWDKEQEFILQKFTKVFSITYRRFLDLKKAEEQTREAQIEAALERVRSRSMAMQNSNELAEILGKIFTELTSLDIELARCIIWIIDPKTESARIWFASSEISGGTKSYFLPNFNHPIYKAYIKAWKDKKLLWKLEIFGEQKKSWDEFLFEKTELKKLPKEAIKAMRSPKKIYTSNTFNEYGVICTAGTEPLSNESNIIFQRFGRVFEQFYTRFEDIKKAEEQAREAQIEVGLERIRASTMAMHKSEQLSETAMVLFNQFYQLGQVPDRISIAIFNPSKKCFEFRVTDQSGSQLTNSYIATINESTTIHKIYEAWKNNEKSTVIKLTGQSLKKWIQFVREGMKLHINEKKIKGRRIHHAAFFSHGFLLYTSNIYMEPQFINLLVRFANVFDQTYTRFLDLRKAELQAREAKIEAVLERVRAKAMAMQKSEDLTESVAITLSELENVKLTFQRCGIGIIDEQEKHAQLYSTTRAEDGKKSIVVGDLSLTQHPMLTQTIDAWKNQEMLLYVLEGEDLKNYYKLISESNFPLPKDSLKEALSLNQQYVYYLMFPAGALYFFSEQNLPKEDIHVLQRFTDVFHLAFTRYMDLQKAEIRARDAVRQASLDRVRGVIASMRSKEDLNRITPLIWKELKALDVPFIRCGVFIMDVENEIIQSYLSTPDGKALGIFNLPFTSELIGELMVDFWEKEKIYKEHWTRTQFLEFMKRLKNTGQIDDPGSYQGTAAPPDKLDLHFIPFKQGMLYVGNTEPLTEDELDLVKSLADAFSIAYARYEDFRELELAKNQIEDTLNELKATQSQLIHAEKMASLGELTAGIAHEIQNPLNFVNNFSDVSIDLIEEFKDERNRKRDERDESLEKEILDDVIQNLEKINHHGLRASSIVKGMLEHSRSSSKEKQLIDINALADEYLRLAYHGLRAKDKSFNADFSLVKDDKLPEIKVISQDIGRVLLNFINNAFYAVSNKAKQGIQNFKPQVIVSTQAMNKAAERSAVEIKVKDNGNGIPKDILEKIFQPFFTTKPTGNGTGLGLSLSYDIIKAHGGEIKVESTEGEGTEFTIVLGLNTNS